MIMNNMWYSEKKSLQLYYIFNFKEDFVENPIKIEISVLELQLSIVQYDLIGFCIKYMPIQIVQYDLIGFMPIQKGI